MAPHSDSPCSLSLLERCPPEVLGYIASHVIAQTFLGPPNDLISLICTSRTIHSALAPERNNDLCASIYELKFDLSAPKRRLTERWWTTRCLARELRIRWSTLRRVRSGIVAHGAQLLQDLWTCLLMVMENDSRNAAQLVCWAGIANYLRTITQNWLRGAVPPDFARAYGCLVLPLVWELVRDEDMVGQWRLDLQRLLHPYIVSGFRHSTFFAPPEFFRLPLCPHGITQLSGPSPSVEIIELYSHRVPIAAPPLTSSALAVFFLAKDPRMPRNTTIKNSKSPTCKPDHHHPPSESFDNDWSRLVSCYDPFSEGSALRGELFPTAVMSGRWEGRILVPSMINYRAMLAGHTPAASVPMLDMHVSFDLHEHHCFANNPLAPGPDDGLNAWIPRGALIETTADYCSIYDPATRTSTRYETCIEGADPPYQTQINSQIKQRWIAVETSSDAPHAPFEEDTVQYDDTPVEMEIDTDSESSSSSSPSSPSHIDDDSEWDDTVEYLTTGISDIVITGNYEETLNGVSRTFTVIGRVRSWDGLIVLLRTPLEGESRSGDWIFRGYLHKKHDFVGRWRGTFTPVGRVGWEGSFFVSKKLR